MGVSGRKGPSAQSFFSSLRARGSISKTAGKGDWRRKKRSVDGAKRTWRSSVWSWILNSGFLMHSAGL